MKVEQVPVAIPHEVETNTGMIFDTSQLSDLSDNNRQKQESHPQNDAEPDNPPLQNFAFADQHVNEDVKLHPNDRQNSVEEEDCSEEDADTEDAAAEENHAEDFSALIHAQLLIIKNPPVTRQHSTTASTQAHISSTNEAHSNIESKKSIKVPWKRRKECPDSCFSEWKTKLFLVNIPHKEKYSQSYIDTSSLTMDVSFSSQFLPIPFSKRMQYLIPPNETN
jgi:hypothetical protein